MLLPYETCFDYWLLFTFKLDILWLITCPLMQLPKAVHGRVVRSNNAYWGHLPDEVILLEEKERSMYILQRSVWEQCSMITHSLTSATALRACRTAQRVDSATHDRCLSIVKSTLSFDFHLGNHGARIIPIWMTRRLGFHWNQTQTREDSKVSTYHVQNWSSICWHCTRSLGMTNPSMAYAEWVWRDTIEHKNRGGKCIALAQHTNLV